MCGGFSITANSKIIKARFKADFADDTNLPNFNARPGQYLPVILDTEPNVVKNVFWGYLPQWIKDPSSKKIINARAESVSTKPFFKDSFSKRRCLVIADGFYEWKPTKSGKQPYRIILKDEGLFAFAGIWDMHKNGKGKDIPGFTIITTGPNKESSKIHDRMPVILQPKDEKIWLKENSSTKTIEKLLKPYPDGKMKAYPVSKKVNIPVNNSPELIEAVKLDK